MTYPLPDFQANLTRLEDRIRAACESSGRNPAEVELMAVTKRFPLASAAEAVRAGIKRLGENRVQEGIEKIQQATFEARWELIGHLQSNKVQPAVEHFDRIQSVDSVKLAGRLNHHSERLGKTLPILLQVNTGKDPGKFGFPPEDTEQALNEILALPYLRVEGFMTIAPLPSTLETARQAFIGLRNLRDRLEASTGKTYAELSMGMSDDLEAAIEAGSTCVRVGSALFGQRPFD